MYDTGLARRLEAAFEEDLRYARKITYEEWNSRGIGERIYELFSFPIRDYL
jgi:phosphatidylserine/phosphatidylglycerophosphate/cardiolipin synthase-like enzyme